MPLDLTKVRRRLNNVKRNLYYGEDVTLRFYDVNTLVLELEENWFMSVGATSNLAIGAEYFELAVAESDDDDDIKLEDIIPMASAIEIAGERYKIVQYERPRALTRQWSLRLESTGMRKGLS